jgi:alpha-aminoadipic semialdehyde synthase
LTSSWTIFRAASHGLTFLNEIGLDPGIDHLLAMKMIDRAKLEGSKVKSFVSWCGGLPAPEASRNPFGYKFSWNPQGVLNAGMNAAHYREDKQDIHIPGDQLYLSARDVFIYPGFRLEGLANRDSLTYGKYYGILGEADTLLRGTLRYKGYSELMYGLLKLGLFDVSEDDHDSRPRNWREFLEKKLTMRLDDDQPTTESLVKAIADRMGISKDHARRLIGALKWLGMLDRNSAIAEDGKTLMEKTRTLLERKLVFGKEERDMVLLHHQIELEDGLGHVSRRSCTLVVYGNPDNHTAMARTVGIPLAIATKLVLENVITRKGVLIPIHKDIYEPLLRELEAQGFRFDEQEDSLF